MLLKHTQHVYLALFHLLSYNLRRLVPSTQPLHPRASSANENELPVAPAHGGTGSASVGRSAAYHEAGATTMVVEKSGGGAGAGGRLGIGKGRKGSDRVARLGWALDDIEARGDGPGARGNRSFGAHRRNGNKVCCPLRCHVGSMEAILLKMCELSTFTVLESTKIMRSVEIVDANVTLAKWKLSWTAMC